MDPQLHPDRSGPGVECKDFGDVAGHVLRSAEDIHDIDSRADIFDFGQGRVTGFVEYVIELRIHWKDPVAGLLHVERDAKRVFVLASLHAYHRDGA